jgi:SAM-dependent methyltransferase
MSVVDEVTLYANAPRERLLDVGCGAGDFLFQATRLGLDVEGVEPDARAAQVAAAAGIRCHLGDLESRQADPSTYDIVRLSHVVEHVPEPRELLDRAVGLLRPGGRIVVIAPNSAGYAACVFGRDWFQLDPPRHCWAFSADHMRRLLERAGLVVDLQMHRSEGDHLYHSFRYCLSGQGSEDMRPSPAAGQLRTFNDLVATFDALGLGDTVLTVGRLPDPVPG